MARTTCVMFAADGIDHFFIIDRNAEAGSPMAKVAVSLEPDGRSTLTDSTDKVVFGIDLRNAYGKYKWYEIESAIDDSHDKAREAYLQPK